MCIRDRPQRKPLGQFRVEIEQRPAAVLAQVPAPIRALTRESRANPVLHRRRDDSDRLRGLRFLADDEQRLGALSLPGRAEPLYLADCHVVQREVVDQRTYITW